MVLGLMQRIKWGRHDVILSTSLTREFLNWAPTVVDRLFVAFSISLACLRPRVFFPSVDLISSSGSSAPVEEMRPRNICSNVTTPVD